MTHLCIPHLAVGVAKHDAACKGERSFEKLHRRAYVRYGQIRIHGLHTGSEAACRLGRSGFRWV